MQSQNDYVVTEKTNNFVIVTVMWLWTGSECVKFHFKIPSNCYKNGKKTLGDTFCHTRYNSTNSEVLMLNSSIVIHIIFTNERLNVIRWQLVNISVKNRQIPKMKYQAIFAKNSLPMTKSITC